MKGSSLQDMLRVAGECKKPKDIYLQLVNANTWFTVLQKEFLPLPTIFHEAVMLSCLINHKRS